MRLVDSAEALATAACAALADGDLLCGEPQAGRLSFILSDIPWKFAEIGARFLGKPIADVESVGLDEMEEAGRALGPQAGDEAPHRKDRS